MTKEMIVEKPLESPYWAGVDCGENGPNTRNCHIGWFSTPERTAQWEMGKKFGENGRILGG